MFSSRKQRDPLADAGLRPDQIASIQAAQELAAAGASPAVIHARVNEIRAAAGQPPAEVLGGPVPASAPDPVEQLERLADLRDRGVLTDVEFAMQKSRILSGG